MKTQKLRAPVSIAVVTSEPTVVGDGTALSDSPRDRGILSLALTGGTSCSLSLRAFINAAWGRAADGGNVDGTFGGAGVVLTTGRTYHFAISDLAAMTRIAVIKTNETGTVTVTATLLNLFEI